MNQLYRVNSFTNGEFGGNLAGVVDNANLMSVDTMQSIAKQVGASETVFIFPSNIADIKFRWFTPNTEVGICFHATIAGLAVLVEQNKLKSNKLTIETQNIILCARITDKGIFIKAPNYKLINQTINTSEILSLLPVLPSNIIDNPGVVEIFSDRELIIEVASFADLENLQPDINSYHKICQQLSVTGISIFTRDTLDKKNQIHTREFAPLYGYLEDPICGMASGAIHKYLNTSQSLNIEQGHFCNTRGLIKLQVSDKNELWIGGKYIIVDSKDLDAS